MKTRSLPSTQKAYDCKTYQMRIKVDANPETLMGRE